MQSEKKKQARLEREEQTRQIDIESAIARVRRCEVRTQLAKQKLAKLIEKFNG